MPKITTRHLRQLAAEGRKFACLTAYDATFARIIDEAGVEVVLVGDTLGMVLQGHDSTLPVTVEDMAYHIGCVRRGTQSALIIGDLPFMSYATPEQALDSAAALMQAGAHVVKLEGGAWLLDTIRLLTERGIPVCAHLGLTPQSVNLFGGFRVQGRQPDNARTILADARAIAAAGAALLVLECVPRDLARRITEAVEMPVIGIGAGPDTDGQVLVLQDMLGLTDHPARFVRDFLGEGGSIPGAIRAYAEAVRNQTFPAAEHCYE